MTFCAMWRRIFIVFFVLLGVAEAVFGLHLPLAREIEAQRHMIGAGAFVAAGLVIFLFDWWLWESGHAGNCGGCG
jgi:hypothetical protein